MSDFFISSLSKCLIVILKLSIIELFLFNFLHFFFPNVIFHSPSTPRTRRRSTEFGGKAFPPSRTPGSPLGTSPPAPAAPSPSLSRSTAFCRARWVLFGKKDSSLQSKVGFVWQEVQLFAEQGGFCLARSTALCRARLVLFHHRFIIFRFYFSSKLVLDYTR